MNMRNWRATVYGGLLRRYANRPRQAFTECRSFSSDQTDDGTEVCGKHAHSASLQSIENSIRHSFIAQLRPDIRVRE